MAYEKIPVQENVPLVVTFTWDDMKYWPPPDANPTWQPSLTVNCDARWTDRDGEHEQEQGSLRLSPYLAGQIIALGAGKGAVVKIEKFTVDKKTQYALEMLAEPQEAGFVIRDKDRQECNLKGEPAAGMQASVGLGATVQANQQQPSAPTRSSGPLKTGVMPLAVADKIFSACWKAANDYETQTEDVRYKIAYTLYAACASEKYEPRMPPDLVEVPEKDKGIDFAATEDKVIAEVVEAIDGEVMSQGGKRASGPQQGVPDRVDDEPF